MSHSKPELPPIDGAAAVRHVEALCGFGDRFVGEPGDALAEEYVAAELAALGLELERTPVTLPSWREDHCELRLADGTVLEATSPYFSPSTDGTLSAEVVYVGDGGEADYDGLDVAGKIVLLEERSIGFGMFWLGGFAARAARHGARAVIVVHPMPWPYRMSMEAGNADIARRFADERVPAVSISTAGGLRLMHALGAGRAGVELTLRTTAGTATTNFLAGIRRGTRAPQDMVIVMGHRDNGAPPGANDDGSGTATMLEVARCLAGTDTERSLMFLSSAGEEGVAEGTYRWLEAIGDERLRRIKAVISLDMFGVGGRLNLVEEAYWPDTEALRHTPWLTEALHEEATRRGYHVGRMQADWGAAESGRFLERGVPAAWFWKADDPAYHSPHDTPDRIDGNMLKVVGEITAAVALRVADGGLG